MDGQGLADVSAAELLSFLKFSLRAGVEVPTSPGNF